MHEIIHQHYLNNHQKLVKRYSFRAGGVHQAEDIVQEAYARALKYFNPDRIDDFDKWFSIILVNSFNDTMRDTIGMSYLDEDDETSLGEVPCNILDNQTRKEVYDLISTKAPSQAEVLTLHIRHGYGVTDIHRQMEVTKGYVSRIIGEFHKELETLYA